MAVWVAGAVYALLGALTVAELAAMRPRSGGLYPLVHDALGEYPGFIVGWTDWLSTCGSMAAVAMVLGEYAGPLIPGMTGQERVTASAVVVGFALLQWRGIRIGDAAQQLTSFFKSLALIALAGVALVMGIDFDIVARHRRGSAHRLRIGGGNHHRAAVRDLHGTTAGPVRSTSARNSGILLATFRAR